MSKSSEHIQFLPQAAVVQLTSLGKTYQLRASGARNPFGRGLLEWEFRFVRCSVSNGVSFEYGEAWMESGFALSEDLPLRKGETFPMERDRAVGALDDARPDRWGERVIRHLIRPPRLSTLDYLYFAGDQ